MISVYIIRRSSVNVLLITVILEQNIQQHNVKDKIPKIQIFGFLSIEVQSVKKIRKRNTPSKFDTNNPRKMKLLQSTWISVYFHLMLLNFS